MNIINLQIFSTRLFSTGIPVILPLFLVSCNLNTPKRTGLRSGFQSEERYQVRRVVAGRDTFADHTVRYVEFDETGEYWDESQIRSAETALESSNNTVHVMYVHGWKNGAITEDVQKFNYFLSRLAGALNGRKSNYKVVGTMLCWRGDRWAHDATVPAYAPDEAIRFANEQIGSVAENGPLWRLYSEKPNYLNRITLAAPRQLGYADRHRAAIRMAGGAMLDAINRLGEASRQSKSNKTILIGHSMGAMIVEKSVYHGLSSKTRRLPADLIFLMNSAAPAQIAKSTLDLLRQNKKSSGSPMIVSMTSETDLATRNLQPLGGATFEGVYYRHLLGDYRNDSGCDGVSQTTLAAKTPGHVAEIHSHHIRNLGLESEDYVLKDLLSDHGPWLFSWNLNPTGEVSDKTRKVAGFLRHTDRQDGLLRFLSADGRNGTIFELTPNEPGGFNPGNSYWILQLPRNISKDHSDIWNPNVSNLMVAIVRKQRANEQAIE